MIFKSGLVNDITVNIIIICIIHIGNLDIKNPLNGVVYDAERTAVFKNIFVTNCIISQIRTSVT